MFKGSADDIYDVIMCVCARVCVCVRMCVYVNAYVRARVCLRVFRVCVCAYHTYCVIMVLSGSLDDLVSTTVR